MFRKCADHPPLYTHFNCANMLEHHSSTSSISDRIETNHTSSDHQSFHRIETNHTPDQRSFHRIKKSKKHFNICRSVQQAYKFVFQLVVLNFLISRCTCFDYFVPSLENFQLCSNGFRVSIFSVSKFNGSSGLT